MSEQVISLFNRVSSLPEEIQDNLMFFWNEDIENELNFDLKISETFEKLNILAQDALSDFKQGKTSEKGFDEL